MLMFILPDARVFITQLTTFQCPLFFHRLRCPCESRDHCSSLWDWHNQQNRLWNTSLLWGWAVGRAWKVSQLLNEPARAHAAKQLAPGTLVQEPSSLLSSKKTVTVLAKSSGWENVCVGVLVNLNSATWYKLANIGEGKPEPLFGHTA